MDYWQPPTKLWWGGSGLQFDGVDDVVTVSNFGTQIPSKEITIEAWVKPRVGSGNDDLICTDPFEPGGGNNRMNVHFPWDSTIYWQFGKPLQSVTVALNSSWVGVWNHFVFTASYSKRVMKIYRNGVEVATGSFTNPYDPTTQATLRIGGRASFPFEGAVDEVRIYNRALSAAEIRYHYNRGKPIYHWQMDEGEGSTAYDGGWDNKDLTISGASWAQGKFGSALSFDGSDYAYTSANLDSFSNFSYSLWFRSLDGTFSIDEYLLNQGTEDPSAYIDTNGKIQIKIDNSTILTAVENVLSDTSWHHLEITGDGTTMKLYLDGKYQASAASAGASAASAIYLGAKDSTPNNPFNGLIDDVRIYNYARSPSQILQDYNAGLGVHFK